MMIRRRRRRSSSLRFFVRKGPAGLPQRALAGPERPEPHQVVGDPSGPDGGPRRRPGDPAGGHPRLPAGVLAQRGLLALLALLLGRCPLAPPGTVGDAPGPKLRRWPRGPVRLPAWRAPFSATRAPTFPPAWRAPVVPARRAPRPAARPPARAPPWRRPWPRP